jgi:class 3 adenylate cyclase
MGSFLHVIHLSFFLQSVTVMFGDIVGFTAWSSMREPSQVFTLLETLYHEFDVLAQRRRIFKVETVGDCYVAVAGLPDPRKDHAVAMARFARDCVNRMMVITKRLEVELGPDTADLGLRIGLHSGPVTAGVLRGEKARFQLFGDTMNTCARIESTGLRNRIHLSEDAAKQIEESGRSHWLIAREGKVFAKGKGEIKTYWLDLRADKGLSVKSGDHSSTFGDLIPSAGDAPATITTVKKPKETLSVKEHHISLSDIGLNDKQMRLVGWNTEILAKILKEVVLCRQNSNVTKDHPRVLRSVEEATKRRSEHSLVLDEVAEIVQLPQHAVKHDPYLRSQDIAALSEEVKEQLKHYVSTVAAMYQANPFHNYEHASHVTMSVVKLLSRIVAPSEEKMLLNLHDHTYGITSDPLTQFTVVLSALIHDIDHPGVPNATLVAERTPLAAVYKEKSVAEQNSVDLAWDLLMEGRYEMLRGVIYVNKVEFDRFRQLLVNTVLATDIMDKDLGARRKARWEKAFSDMALNESPMDTVNRKATIVIEHLIQASDVAHTMQHWHIYRKWNERLFREMYKAYADGRANACPSLNWYKGELGFFDFYIIPLAKKLKDCGVFGVSSDEYLNYAIQNRSEWESRGQAVVAEMLEAVKREGAFA